VCLHGVNRNNFRFYLFTVIINLRGAGEAQFGARWDVTGIKAGRDEIERLKWRVLD
jgi:hypothetical protein